MGLMVLAACPGRALGSDPPRARQRGASPVPDLTVTRSPAALLTFPLLVEAVLAAFGEAIFGAGRRRVLAELPVGRLIGSVLVVTTVPIVAGMLRRRAPAFTARAELLVARVATLFFAAIVVATFVSHRHTIPPTCRRWTGDPGAQLRRHGPGLRPG